MSYLEIQKKGNLIYIKGIISEQSDFSKVFEGIQEKCTIDFEGIERINSCGVREWAKTIKDLNIEIEYINCPPVVVEQFNMVPEFLGKKAKVKSFYARFYCEDCDIEELFLFDSKQFLSNNDNLVVPEFLCECGAYFLFDENENEYFLFLEY